MTALTLADFLRARLGEDEAVVRSYAREPSPIGTPLAERVGSIYHPDCDPDRLADVEAYEGGVAHPARVLADVEAKRRIVDEHSDQPGWPHECQGWVLDGQRRDVGFWENCPTLRLLALPYASHPDYRQEWAL